MWVLGFYMWHLSLTTKLSEFMKCNIVILKNGNFLRTLESGSFRLIILTLDLGSFGNKLFFFSGNVCFLFATANEMKDSNIHWNLVQNLENCEKLVHPCTIFCKEKGFMFYHVSDQGGFLGTQDLFFAHFTTFACAFFAVILSNCLTIAYASFDPKKIKSTPSFSR